MKQKIWIVVLGCVLLLCGCSPSDKVKITGRTYEFSVVSQRDIPNELMEQMELQKENGFQISYMDEKYLYLAVGYGRQETKGYKILVKRLQEEGDKLYFETELKGPNEEKIVTKRASYPYIVIKTEAIQKDIVYL